MSIPADLIADAARRIGVAHADLAAIAAQGAERAYADGERLFSESSPRDWLGVVLSGEVMIRRGAQARSTLLAILSGHALVGESMLLDDSPHSATAIARGATRVWQIP